MKINLQAILRKLLTTNIVLSRFRWGRNNVQTCFGRKAKMTLRTKDETAMLCMVKCREGKTDMQEVLYHLQLYKMTWAGCGSISLAAVITLMIFQLHCSTFKSMR